jgi:hypothetical protein
MSETANLPDVKREIESIYGSIKGTIVAGNFNAVTLITILPQLMELAGKCNDFDGIQKKSIVIGVVDHIIVDNVDNLDLENTLRQMVPTAIDTMYDVWLKRYIFKEQIQGCFAHCKKK